MLVRKITMTPSIEPLLSKVIFTNSLFCDSLSCAFSQSIHSFPLSCVGCARAFSLPVLVGICLVRVCSRLSGCTPSDPSQFARHCRILDHFAFFSRFFQYDKFLSTNEQCRAAACQCPNAVSPFAENSSTCSTIPLATNAGAWTLLEFVLNVLVDHVYPSGGAVFNKVNWVTPVHGPGCSMSPSTFQKSLTFLQNI